MWQVAFFIQILVKKTQFAWIAYYVDPVVAIVMACFLLIEPVKMIFVNLKNLVLFAPEQDIMDSIRFVAEKHMDKVYCDIEFLDVFRREEKHGLRFILKVTMI